MESMVRVKGVKSKHIIQRIRQLCNYKQINQVYIFTYMPMVDMRYDLN